LLGRMIQAAVSRQREYLADASAVQFTRNPEGLSSALKKIGGYSAGSRLMSSQAQAISHLMFSNGLSESWSAMMSTHPPLAERIRRLEPTFSGEFTRVAEVVEPATYTAAFAPVDRVVSPNTPLIRASDIPRRVGRTVPIAYAAGLIETLPAPLRDATTNAWSATALMYALLLSNEPQWRKTQIGQLQAFNDAVASEAVSLAELLAGCDRRARLPLLSLALPALRQMSRPQWDHVRNVLTEMIRCDAQIDVFEFVIEKIIERHIDAHFDGRKAAIVQYYSFNPLADDFAVILSTLANCGDASITAVREAFSRGLAVLPMFAGLQLHQMSACGVGALAAALNRIAEAVPQIRIKLLDASAQVIAADGFINVHEAELVRAIADALDVPIPPLIQGITSADCATNDLTSAAG
jgi:hypothetical protein